MKCEQREDLPDLSIPFLTSAQVGFLADVTLFRKEAQAQAMRDGPRSTSNTKDRGRGPIRSVLKDPEFSVQHLPYEPKNLIVISNPPTIDVEDGDNNDRDDSEEREDEHKNAAIKAR